MRNDDFDTPSTHDQTPEGGTSAPGPVGEGPTNEETLSPLDENGEPAPVPEPTVQDRPGPVIRLIQLLEASGSELFHRPSGHPFARITVGRTRPVYPVRSETFHQYLRSLYYRETGHPLNREALKAAADTLDARGRFASPEHEVYLRVAPRPNGGVTIDLGDDEWRTAEVRPGGWELVTDSPTRFQRPQGMRPLPVPVRGGRFVDLRRFLNLRSDDDWLLVAAWVVAALRPTGPYPLLLICGEPGTAKSTCARAVRRVCDPSAMELRSQPGDARDLAVATRHSWVLGYDNVSELSVRLSDLLCQCATGGSFATRSLYSDGEETVFQLSQPVVMTSVEDVTGQADLLDRSLVVSPAPIPDGKRRVEAEFWAEFEAAWPLILGGLLDTFAAALGLLPGIRAEKNALPRMADFAELGEAVSRALGNPKGRFLRALAANRQDADLSIMEGSTLAPAVFTLLRESPERSFRGTATRLLDQLTKVASAHGRTPRGWPPNAQAMSGQLRRLAPALRRHGIQFSFAKVGHYRTHEIHLTFTPPRSEEPPSAASAAPWNALSDRELGADGGTGPDPTATQPRERDRGDVS